MTAYGDLYDLELKRGAHREIIPELTERVAEHPLREQFAGQLMRALHRSGRQARALTTYRQLRRRLAEQLGFEPSAGLHRLYEEIRAAPPGAGGQPRTELGGQQPTGESASPPPMQLPPTPAVFVGRTAELAEMERASAGGVSVLVASGPAGVGKTCLAVQHARAVADQFSDGQLYVDLRGHAPSPALEPVDALSQLLLGLGADPRRIPVDTEAATVAYRSLLSGRKVLVVLDNAATVQQVQPLLPASPGCLALVTSRDRLSGLVTEGGHRLSVDLLPPDEAHELLVRLLGADRVAAEPTQVTELVAACARLPLALRIAAAQLADQPRRSIADYLAELREGPLATLEIKEDEQSAVAGAFDLSYQRLDTDTRRLFRLLGLVPGPDVSIDAAAALSGLDPQDASRHARRLAAAHLVDEHQPGRYRLHDLLRHYARSRAEAEEPAEARTHALERLMAWYYQGKEAASSMLRPSRAGLPPRDFPDGVLPPAIGIPAEAVSWSKAEHANIAAAIASAGDDVPVHWSWDLALGHGTVMSDLGHRPGSMAIFDKAAQDARTMDDSLALARSLIGLGGTLLYVDIRRAVGVYVDAVKHAERAGEHFLLGICLNNLGLVYQDLGDLEAADTYLTRSLAVKRNNDGRGVESTLLNLANLAELRGRFVAAAQMYEEVIELVGDTSHDVAVRAAANLEGVRVELGDLSETFVVLDRLERLGSEHGGARTELSAKTLRANVYIDLGRIADALSQAHLAVSQAEDVGDARYRARTRTALGRAYFRSGHGEQARTELVQALSISQDAGELQPRIDALIGLAQVELQLGDVSSAESHAREALTLTGDQFRAKEAVALVSLARVELVTDRVAEAVAHAEQALAIHRDTGQPLAQARALHVLGEAERAAGNEERADEHLRQAHGMFVAYGAPEATEFVAP